MHKSPVNSSYAIGKKLSTPPRAVVEWPEGLMGPPIIFPMGQTFEESEEIRRLFERLLQTAKEGAVGPGQ